MDKIIKNAKITFNKRVSYQNKTNNNDLKHQ